MLRSVLAYCGGLLLLAALSACDREVLPLTGAPAEQVPVQLSLSLEGHGSTSTKTDISVITEMKETPVFRGVNDIRVIPFASKKSITASDPTLYNILYLSGFNKEGLLGECNAFLYNNQTSLLPLKTASALVYGRSRQPQEVNTVELKHRYGSLLERGFVDEGGNAAQYVEKASDLGFDPDVMFPGSDTPPEAAVIAETLTRIVNGTMRDANNEVQPYYPSYDIEVYYGNAQHETLHFYWDGTLGDFNLKDYYEEFTAAGALMPGSGTNVASMISDLYNNLKNYDILNSTPYEFVKDGVAYEFVYKDANHNSILTNGDVYNGVKEMIITRIEHCESLFLSTSPSFIYTLVFADENVATYPDRYGLPAGAAVVRWTPSGFVVPLQNGLDGIAPLSSYCFPPPLYYFANTTICTSHQMVGASQYAEADDWKEFLNSSYTAGPVVTGLTKSIAMEDPLQYGVGMLAAKVRASAIAGKLPDNDGLVYTNVDVTEPVFPLTGIIVGRQYPLAFNFTPQYVSEDTPQYNLYDNEISGPYLTVYDDDADLPEFRTLVMQTPDEKDVYVCLEFRNDSEDYFYGAEGRILPGHKFYLVGRLPMPAAADRPEGVNSVFMQDHVTTATFVIKSLENAHCAIPDMGIPNLSVGVEVQLNWELSTTDVPLE